MPGNATAGQMLLLSPTKPGRDFDDAISDPAPGPPAGRLQDGGRQVTAPGPHLDDVQGARPSRRQGQGPAGDRLAQQGRQGRDGGKIAARPADGFGPDIVPAVRVIQSRGHEFVDPQSARRMGGGQIGQEPRQPAARSWR